MFPRRNRQTTCLPDLGRNAGPIKGALWLKLGKIPESMSKYGRPGDLLLSCRKLEEVPAFRRGKQVDIAGGVIYIYIHTYIYMYIQTYRHTCVQTHIHPCTHIQNVHICLCIRISIGHVHVLMYGVTIHSTL